MKSFDMTAAERISLRYVYVKYREAEGGGWPRLKTKSFDKKTAERISLRYV
jgi:hypothetical protein